MASPLLIDTSAWVEALRPGGHAATREAVREALVDGQARLCELVLLELWNGARGQAETTMLRQLAAEVPMLAMTGEVWRVAWALAHEFRGRGITVPSTDIAIAACARCHGAGLLHRDADFDRIAASPSRGSRSR